MFSSTTKYLYSVSLEWIFEGDCPEAVRAGGCPKNTTELLWVGLPVTSCALRIELIRGASAALLNTKLSDTTEPTQRAWGGPELAPRPRIAPVVPSGGWDAPMAPRGRQPIVQQPTKALESSKSCCATLPANNSGGDDGTNNSRLLNAVARRRCVYQCNTQRIRICLREMLI